MSAADLEPRGDRSETLTRRISIFGMGLLPFLLTIGPFVLVTGGIGWIGITDWIAGRKVAHVDPAAWVRHSLTELRAAYGEPDHLFEDGTGASYSWGSGILMERHSMLFWMDANQRVTSAEWLVHDGWMDD